MKILINSIVITILLLSLLFLIGCGMADGDRVTAQQVLDQNPNADILQYGKRIYNNMTDVEWFQTEKPNYEKYNLLGEIKLQTNEAKKFESFVASKLSEGTKVYSTGAKQYGMLIVEFEGKELYYMEFLEG